MIWRKFWSLRCIFRNMEKKEVMEENQDRSQLLFGVSEPAVNVCISWFLCFFILISFVFD